ncbi:MAG: hypothetical protein JWO32_1908 [Bacteroidetes bacterium]|nr:hypothetical protein [Bacteroidota bacterium]
MKIKLFFLLSISFILAKGQVRSPGIIENRMLLQSESFKARTDYSNMILNIATGDFYLSFDAATLQTSDVKLDSVIRSKGQQIIVYKGNIGENIFRFNQQIDDEKEYPMAGVLTANGQESGCISQFNPKSLADKSDVKNYRMDFKLVVDADKILIKGLENKLTKQVVFQVMGGKLNVQP